MTAKIDGTNGVLQQYDYQTPATGFSYTFAAGTQMLFMVPSGTLASGTITMPSAPADGMVITFSSSQQITALTLQGNTGQSVSNAVTFLPAKTAASYVYRLANTTWYPCQTVPGAGSQLVSATAQNSTSGTSIDFTGIPSWVKRVTVMLNAISTNGTSPPQIQIGDGSIQTSGYTGTNAAFLSGASYSAANFTTGFGIGQSTSYWNSSVTVSGMVTLCLISSNIWVASGVLGRTDSASMYWTGGNKTLTNALDRVRITTVNGTDTFDAGSINILFE